MPGNTSMPGSIRSPILLTLITSFLLAAWSSAAHAQIRFDLPAQPLAQSLTALGSLANLNIYFDAPTVDGIQAPALKAQLSADDALAKLLSGTHLRAVRVDENTVRVVSESEPKHAQTVKEPATGASSRPPAVHLAYAEAGPPPVVNTSVDSSASERRQLTPLSEVVVTAEKRDERLQDVPVPVTAISATTLVENNQLRIQDFYTTVPGLSVTPQASISYQSLSIRGITTGVSSNPSVGIVIDDVPFGSSTAAGGGGGTPIPDIDPGDLARVEVLRGPQGTLYGASSMG